MKNILEGILIFGLFALVGLGIWASTSNFLHEISDNDTQIAEVQEAEDPSPHEPEKIEEEQEEEKPQVQQQEQSKVEEKPKLQSLGVYKITAYCSCSKCCGKTDGITASGTHVTAGRTIAAPKEFAFGTKIMINGHIYTVEDRGGAIKGNRIDIYFNSHQEALNFGVQYIEIFKVNE